MKPSLTNVPEFEDGLVVESVVIVSGAKVVDTFRSDGAVEEARDGAAVVFEVAKAIAGKAKNKTVNDSRPRLGIIEIEAPLL